MLGIRGLNKHSLVFLIILRITGLVDRNNKAFKMKSLWLFSIQHGILASFVLLLLLIHSFPQLQVLAEDSTDLPVCNKSSNFFALNSSSTTIQNFSSPNYPLDYPSYSYCVWVLGAPLGQLVKLTFSIFSIYTPSSADSQQCPYAYIRVIEQDNQGNSYVVGRFCGESKPQTIYSTGGQLRVEFKNTFWVSAKGFVAKYSAIQPGTACSPQNTLDENSNILLHTAQGRIASPRFPSSFSDAIDCTWKISLPNHQAVNLTFSTFTKPQRILCSSSSLEVYNSQYGHGHGTKLGVLCGESLPPVIYSSGRFLSLRLKAVNPGSAVNFVASFHSLIQVINGSCGSTDNNNLINIQGTAGSIFSPNYPEDYPINKDCTWHVTVPSGFSIRLTFHAFQLASGISCEDFVEVRDGKYSSSPLKGKFCGRVVPPALITTGHQMNLRFKSNYASSSKGFLAVFEATTEVPEHKTTPRIQPGVCSPAYSSKINNNLQLSGTSGTILSPNYPLQYPNGISCTWTVTVPKGQRIKLSFDDFWIDDQRGCHGDYLEVRDGLKDASPQLGKRYCGNKEPGEIFTTDSHMRLHFSSDESATSQGFKAKYKAVDKPFNRFIVVGIAIGSIMVVLVLIFIYCKIKKKRNKEHEDEVENEEDEIDIELRECHSSTPTETPSNPLLGNGTDVPNNHAPPNYYDVVYAPNGQPGHSAPHCNGSEKLTTDPLPEEEYTWFKQKKRKSKGFE